jgi:hypothetical protein
MRYNKKANSQRTLATLKTLTPHSEKPEWNAITGRSSSLPALDKATPVKKKKQPKLRNYFFEHSNLQDIKNFITTKNDPTMDNSMLSNMSQFSMASIPMKRKSKVNGFTERSRNGSEDKSFS